MEGRRIFPELTVDDNLRAGGFTRKNKAELKASYERVMELFPVLAQRRKSTAGYLSGGEQQMLAIGRALMASPRLLLLDEPSLGLAPLIVEQIRDDHRRDQRPGHERPLVEQNATMALSIAGHGYVMENGKVVKDGPADELLEDQDIQEFYLGMGERGDVVPRRQELPPRKKRWSRVTEHSSRSTDLTLRFGGVTALDDVSFDVGDGELFAVIGPNGAGQDVDLQLPQRGVPPAGGPHPARRHRADRQAAARRRRPWASPARSRTSACSPTSTSSTTSCSAATT